MSWKKITSERDWFFSKHLPDWQKIQVRELQKSLPRSKNMLWMLSSGTQSVFSTKAIALKHEAIFASSDSVNHHLEATAKDRWAVVIPDYYIGGLSIYARALLSRSKFFTCSGKWNPKKFGKFLSENKITLTSLVPTQVHDLVVAKVRSPETLRAAVIGGGALNPELYKQARELGWPVLTSYGLTETCSQVATASLKSLLKNEYPALKVLRHAKIRIEERIEIKAESLCTYIATINSEGARTLEQAAPSGWFKTADMGTLDRAGLRVLGRADDVVKVKGVLVPLLELEHELHSELDRQLSVLAVSDPREEHRLLLVVEDHSSLDTKLEAYNAKVPSTRRIRGFIKVEKIPRGEMGKIKKAELKKILGF